MGHHRWSLLFVILIVFGVAACGETGTPATQAPTAIPTTAPTPKPSQVTHGMPHIGGQISDFYGKYGTPHNQGAGNSQTWLVSDNPTVLVAADPDASGKVTQVIVTSSADWTISQTKTYCLPFLPEGATEFNTAGNFIDYHSNIGEIVMLLVASSCTITFGQS